MLVIRLKPVGRKHQISFRIVVTEKRSKLNGPYREDLGFYNPASDKFAVNAERAKYWLGVGAQPSDTVYNIFVSAGVIEGPKKIVKIKKAKKSKEKENIQATADTAASNGSSTEAATATSNNSPAEADTAASNSSSTEAVKKEEAAEVETPAAE